MCVITGRCRAAANTTSLSNLDRRLLSSNNSPRMRILGISAFYHDSAAALVRDGEIVAAAQEERYHTFKGQPRSMPAPRRSNLRKRSVGFKDGWNLARARWVADRF